MECEGGTHSGWLPTFERRCLLGKCERGEDVDGRNVPTGLWQCLLHEKDTEISVPMQDRNGSMQSRQRFLHQLGSTPVIYQSAAPQGGKVGDGATKQIVLNLSKQGWEAAELAPRVAARQWLQHRRATTDASGWTRRVAGGGPGDQFG